MLLVLPQQGCVGTSQCDDLANVSSSVARFICEQLANGDTLPTSSQKAHLAIVEDYVNDIQRAATLAVTTYRERGEFERASQLEFESTKLQAVLSQIQKQRSRFK